ncbi:MAG: hypothetical protein JO225_07900, partial [Candidatus Eremiobacteraeota bacterium]|nr:hypothetical protein [Candidatus Eremiobacteraeota bacterium]
MIDGHPVAYGHKRGNNLGYNFDVSPTFALRDVQITFGSGGSDLVGISAIGGVIDMRTLDPTPVLHTSYTQAYGQWANLVSSLTATGPITNRLSFALAGGVQSRNGYFRHNSFFQPAAAYDQSAPHASPDYQSGIYPDDSTVVQRGALVKLRYAFGKPDNLSHLTVHGLSQYYWDDKTGNGDGDYLPYQTALASGQAQLAGYTGTACPAGTFQAFNSNGAPNGTSPNGNPNGGIACQTPQQYAQFNAGFQGTGPTWQAFTVQDYGVRLDSPFGATNLSIDAYTNNYAQTYDRTFQLPYNAVAGDNPSWQNPSVGSTGVIVSDELQGRNNDVGVGYAYYNYAYKFLQNGTLLPSPTVHETAMLFHDTYHPEGSPLTVYMNAAQKTSTITHSTYFDPRLSVVYAATRNDVMRLAGGKTTSQPYATFVYTPLSLIASSGLTGNITCGTLNAIGSGGNPNLLPEKGTDEELSLGHRFSGDTQIQATLYNTNVNGKVYGTLVPVSQFSDAFLGDISSFIGKIQGSCPGDPRSQLGISVQSNVGHFISRGIDLAGRVRANRHLFFDYDYSVESSFIRSLPDSVLANNLTIVPNAQLPTVPVHKYNAAVDYTLGRAIDLRLTDYYVGINNPKHSPAYSYANFQIGAPVGNHSVVNLAVDNVFNQNADIRGRLGLGVPLPLNQFATNYAPYIGQSATELYGLPFRQFLLSYTYKAR